jgi:C-terminal processing protease CtpA/Prc
MAKLQQDYMLQYPITDFVTVNGVRLEGNGVSPVVEAPAISKFGQPDVAVQKAVALLHRKQPIENPVIHT